MANYLVTNTQFGANLRSAASENANKIGNLAFATRLAEIAPSPTKWKQVRVLDGPFSGQSGFVSDANLTANLSNAVVSVVRSAARYWDKFERGAGKETVQPFKGFVLAMWDALGGGRPPNDDTSHRKWPWSAAGMSAFFRDADGYADFKFSAGHSRYIKDSIARRGNGAAPFWGARLTEEKPVIGDLVVQWREVAQTYAKVESIANDPDAGFSSHTDLVCEMRDDYLWALGANNSNSVSRKKYHLDANGFLVAENNVFMLMKNKR